MHAVGSKKFTSDFNAKQSDLVGAAKVQSDGEGIHVHVGCKHGFVLVSGERDDTLQPACFKEKCRK